MTRWRNFSIWLGWQWGVRSKKLQKANWLATTVIAAGVFCVIIGVATGKGLQNAIQHKVEDFHGHVQIRSYGEMQTAEAQAFTISPDNLAQIESLIQGKSGGVITSSLKPGMANHSNQMKATLLTGLSDLPKSMEQYLLRGNPPSWATPESPKKEVWISLNIAEYLNLDIDSSFEMYFSRDANSLPTLRYFQVAGIYETGLVEWDSETIFCHESQVQKLNRWEKDEHQAVLLYDNEGLTKSGLDELLSVLPPTLNVFTARDDYPQMYQWLDLFDMNILLLGAILFFVAAANSVVVVLIRIIERQTSIGILQTMGFSITNLKISIITLLSRSLFTGMLIGNALAFSLLYIQERYEIIGLDPQTYYVDTVPVFWDWSSFLVINLGIFLAVVIAALLPLKILSKIRPEQVLRMQ